MNKTTGEPFLQSATWPHDKNDDASHEENNSVVINVLRLHRCDIKCYMLLPEPQWRKSLEAVTSRMRFSLPQRYRWSDMKSFSYTQASVKDCKSPFKQLICQFCQWFGTWCFTESDYVSVWCVIWAVLFFWPGQDEMTLYGYRKYLAGQAAPLPLTAAEEELKQIKLSEVHRRKHTHTRELFWSRSLAASKTRPSEEK